MKSWQLLKQTSLRYEVKANWSSRDICGCVVSGAIPSFHKKSAEEKEATRPRTQCSQRAHICACSVQALRWTTKPKFLASKVGLYWGLFLSALPCMVELALNSRNGQMTGWVSICLPHSNRESKLGRTSCWRRVPLEIFIILKLASGQQRSWECHLLTEQTLIVWITVLSDYL